MNWLIIDYLISFGLILTRVMYNIHTGLNLKQIFIYTGKGSNSLLNHSDLKVAGFHTYNQKRENFVNYFL